MITKYDELLCHQTVDYFDSIHTSAREWAERLICHLHDRAGRLHLSAGFGLYPNRNVMDAYGTVTLEAKSQYGVRASRELFPILDDVTVGPFSYEIIEPLRQVRYTLGENDHGLSYDIEFEGRFPCHTEDTQCFKSRGRVVEHTNRYDQAGRASGWITVEGKTFELNKEDYMIERDHSWGIRRDQGSAFEVDVQPGEIPEGYLYSWGVLQFDGWGASYHIRENWDGTALLSSGAVFYPEGSGQGETRLVSIDHDFKFQGLRKMANGSRLIFKLVDGSTKELTLRPQNYCCLRVGGYFGYEGFVHGKWLGPSFTDGVTVDLTDPEQLTGASFLDNTSCEIRCGGEVGYGVFELVLVGKYPKYGFQGY
jgi:hypothetical protein